MVHSIACVSAECVVRRAGRRRRRQVAGVGAGGTSHALWRVGGLGQTDIIEEYLDRLGGPGRTALRREDVQERGGRQRSGM